MIPDINRSILPLITYHHRHYLDPINEWPVYRGPVSAAGRSIQPVGSQSASPTTTPSTALALRLQRSLFSRKFVAAIFGDPLLPSF